MGSSPKGVAALLETAIIDKQQLWHVTTGFPGRQRAQYKDGFCIRRNCYDDALVYVDYTRITGTNTEDTAAGGYNEAQLLDQRCKLQHRSLLWWLLQGGAQ